MDKSIDIVFGDRFSYTLSAFHMNVFEIEVPISHSEYAVQQVIEHFTLWDSLVR